MKKLFKIIGIVILFIIALLIATPFFLESKIDAIVRNYADNNLNANLNFADIRLSLITSFPNAEVHIEDLEIINRAPFENETLATAKDISLKMPIMELLKDSGEPLVVQEIIAEELMLTVKSDTNGTSNYNIIIEKEPESGNKTNSNTFSFNIESYSISNSAFTYIDEKTNSTTYLTELNHKGKGLFSGNRSELDTQTSANVSITIDSITYLNNTSTKLDALIELDLKNNIYSFRNNRALINALPLEFEGFVKLVDADQEMDLRFKNPGSSFKDFLAVIPQEYAEDIENVNTTGDFSINGEINGLLSEQTIPSFKIKIISDNASFKYPSLPKKVEGITINAEIVNTTGLAKDTYVDVNAFNFKIDEDKFKSEAHILDLGENIRINANLDGVLNLANITKAYPLKLENQLSGILMLKLNTNFDMAAIKSNNYSRIKNSGQVDISNFVFSSKDIVNPIQINTANLSFTPGVVNLKKFDAITGSSEFSATGTIRNLLGFLLSDKKLQGNFNVQSDSFTISDFMVENGDEAISSNKTTIDKEPLKIPDFLDCTIKADAREVLYDNLILSNVKGELRIKDQQAELNNMTSNIFDGKLVMTGNVSTKEKRPKFDVTIGMKGFNISKSFKDLEMLQALAPLGKVLQGQLNANFEINGLLNNNFSPNLNTIAGNANAQLITTKVNTSNSPVLNELARKLKFINLNDLKVKDVEAQLSFKDGSVVVEPFTLNYKDIPIEISGSHSFSNQMDYNANFQVPAKYLGSEINRLIGQINDNQINGISVPVKAKINGTFLKPEINTDLSSSVSNLTKQLVEIQKQKLISAGKDNLNSFIDDLLGKETSDTTRARTKSQDTSKVKSTEESVKKEAESILNNLIKGRTTQKSKKREDSIKND